MYVHNAIVVAGDDGIGVWAEHNKPQVGADVACMRVQGEYKVPPGFGSRKEMAKINTKHPHMVSKDASSVQVLFCDIFEFFD